MAKKSETKAAAPKKEAKQQYFSKSYYIKGYGGVAAGDAVTKEAIDCWNKVVKSDSKPATHTI